MGIVNQKKSNKMAKQESIITLNGTIANISFFKTKDGYNARKKTGVSKAEMESNPNFDRTRENMAEFGRAAKAAKLLRKALLESIVGSRDRKMNTRLQKAMMTVLRADTTSTRGQRNVIDGEAELLQGFEFNVNGPLSTTMQATPKATVDRVTGNCSVSIPPYDPVKIILQAEGATDYRFGLTAASINFETKETEVLSTQSAYLPLKGGITTQLDLTVALQPGSTHPIFMALTIEFVQETNGQKYALKSGEFNACALVKVDGGV